MAAGSNQLPRGTWMPPILLLAAALLFAAPALGVTAKTTRVSVSSSEAEGDGGSFAHPSISATGRFIAFESLADAVSNALTWPKLGVLLMATFGMAGLVLAASGVFGVIAFVAAQRSGEMAVRIALGATRGRVFRLILGQAGALAVGGLVIGVLLAWWMGASMSRYVYQVAPANLLVLGGSAALVFVVALGATLPSAKRAAATEPARVLRS